VGDDVYARVREQFSEKELSDLSFAVAACANLAPIRLVAHSGARHTRIHSPFFLIDCEMPLITRGKALGVCSARAQGRM
jgi:hypothetical protein